MPLSPIRLALLISGSGRTLQNFVDVIAQGRLDAKIEIVISSRPGVAGLDRARAAGLPAETVPRKAFTSDASFSDAISAILDRYSPDLVLLAGFLSFWRIPDRWLGRVLNIHPALLPQFGGRGMYGHRVHEAILKAGVRETGCTVHFADNQYDHGPAVLQRKTAVLPKDTPESLAERVFLEECQAYPEAVRLFAAGKLDPGPAWRANHRVP